MAHLKKVKCAAQILLQQSLEENGRISEKKVSEILNSLRNDPPINHIEILKYFQFLVKKTMSNYQGMVEFAGGDGTDLIKKLSNLPSIDNANIELVANKNPSLIAGFKVKIRDDVYEDSISNRLSNLRKALA